MTWTPERIEQELAPHARNLMGQRFGRWEVIGLAKKRHDHQRVRWMCRCSCGAVRVCRGTSLTCGDSRSCGCANAADPDRPAPSRTPEYFVWKEMVSRCHNEENANYYLYGGRGIRVCLRWRKSLTAFMEDMGSRPSNQHSIERNDNDADYCPDNCRWATWIEQCNNTRRNRRLTHGDRTLTIAQWSRELGFKPWVLSSRLRLGWPVARALTEPINEHR